MNTSFSLRVGQAINGGNGYGIIESETECDDNSWDANSPIIYKFATQYNEIYKKSYSLHCDLGKSTSDPRNILGIGREIKKKMDGDIGLKIAGAMSALCRYSPDRFIIFCKVAGDNPINIMEYAFGDHIKEIQRVMDSGSRDYRDVDKWCEENRAIKDTASFRNYIFDHPVIKAIYNTIKNDEMKETLKMITSGEQDHFTILIREYNSPIPDDITEGIYKTQILSKMLYYKQLMNGNKIIYLDPENKLHTLTSEDAITPLGDISQFARVQCKIRVYELLDGVCLRVDLYTEDSRGISTNSKQFHITDSQHLINNKSYKVKLIFADIDIPSTATNRGDMTMSISCISQAAQDEQVDNLAVADLGTRDSLRGVYCDYNNRILGLPFWNTGKDTWGAVRNAGGIRAVLSFTTQWVAEKIVSILCEKQRTNLTNAHPVLKRLFDTVIKSIIKNYSDYTKKSTSIPGVKEWNLNLLYSQMTGIPLTQPSVIVPQSPVAVTTPPPRQQPSIADDNASITDTSSVTSMETASSSDDETHNKYITFELATKELIIMSLGREIIRINSYGSGSGLRDWLKAIYDTKTDDDFIRWIGVFKAINKTHGI